jgi:hypothetical protein
MRLEEGLWLEGAYYIDHNPEGELRLVGPRNHLYYGSTGLAGGQLRVLDVSPRGHEIEVRLELKPGQSFIPDPAMGHIRRVRQYTQKINQADLTFAQAEQAHPGELHPNQVSTEIKDDRLTVTYLRRYGRDYYGTRLQWPHARLTRDDDRHGFYLSDTEPTSLTITTITSAPAPAYHGPLLQPSNYQLDRLDPYWRGYAQGLLDRTTAEIDHLVRHGKTSGYDYGTVFPRDWMESADLLGADLAPAGLRHMYAESLRHVNDSGTGWHEDVVGEFKYERDEEIDHLSHNLGEFITPDHPLNQSFRRLFDQLDELLIRRHMIDIEPRYLLGLRTIPPGTFNAATLDRLRRIARFVIQRAQSEDLITFNKVALPFRRQRGNEYYLQGNWRDSDLAFKQIDPLIAPFDVNVVFYPQALRAIREYHELLQIDAARADQAIAKWNRVRDWYRFTNPDGRPAFALALYGLSHQDGRLRYHQMRVNHLDEASDQFYGEPSEAEAKSFAERLLSPQYFFTPSGPILVGHDQGYDHSYYHGEVIWAKQAAYAIAGVERSLQRGRREQWSPDTLAILRAALIATSEACLQAFRTLGAIPEVHYDDHGTPRLYNDQPKPEGVMNKIQLWSAAGARRILQSYLPHAQAGPAFHAAGHPTALPTLSNK